MFRKISNERQHKRNEMMKSQELMKQLYSSTGLDFLADGGADFEHAITVTGESRKLIHINCALTKLKISS